MYFYTRKRKSALSSWKIGECQIAPDSRDDQCPVSRARSILKHFTMLNSSTKLFRFLTHCLIIINLYIVLEKILYNMYINLLIILAILKFSTVDGYRCYYDMGVSDCHDCGETNCKRNSVSDWDWDSTCQWNTYTKRCAPGKGKSSLKFSNIISLALQS